MSPGNRHSTEGEIESGDVVVSHVNGTSDLFVVATVLSAVGDLVLDLVSTTKGRAAAIGRARAQCPAERDVWLFGGSAGAYVKAEPRTARAA
jgi:hypothetical protein